MSDTDPRIDESNSELVEIIRSELSDNGALRFDHFMQLVLYHPQHGYYTSSRTAPGRSGDFITAPEAHPIFGATLARQVVKFDERLGHPERFTLIEYGAGSGRLVRPLLATLRQEHPDLYRRLAYVPIETNQNRLAELRVHLESGGHAERIADESTVADAIGCALANEFVDAFPVRRIVMDNSCLQEVYVVWNGDWFSESHRPLVDDLEIDHYIARHGFEVHDGDVLEFHPEICSWVDDLSTRIASGFALVIDYGYPAEDLFQAHRRTGTLKAYFQHGVSEEIYRGIGKQDLTAHVNFSEVTHHAARNGFELEQLTTQAEFLEQLGIGQRLLAIQQSDQVTAEDYLAARAAVLRMIDPGAMGRFRTLVLSRRVAQT
jgi:SAM-dependent MidA family methyltransferase